MVVKFDGSGALAGSSGSTGTGSNSLRALISGSAIPLNGGTVPAPAQRAPNSVQQTYGGSVPAPTQLQQPWQGSNVGTVPWSGSQQYTQQQASMAAGAPAAPAIPQGPIAGGRQAYNQMDAAGQAATDQSWLAGDSDYTAQTAEYEKALKSFVDRIANQRKGFQEDADLATASTNRNQETSLNGLGEDFGARGLSYSGMFDTTKNETNQRFNDAKGGIERIRTKNDTDAVNRETDYRAENAISQSNASRASLGRQAQRQALIDSGGY